MLRQSNIIVIDDEETMRDSCFQILTKEGFNVETAKDGNEGLAKIKKESFDLVILDLKMPGLNGLDLIEQLKAVSPKTQTIVITAYSSPELEDEAHRLRAYRYLEKPFHIQELMCTVQEALS